ncbi:FUSC family protein [Microbacterium gorillae]|uniref:FUSC family protein n=1 Tax=Microbacterium gorillae TaxID=1231063 RepID=UPI00058CBDE3|nr:FUSC family protein [Microbacterium gorillae]
MRLTSTFRATARTSLLQVLKSALAAGLSWVVAELLIHGQPPVFAAIAGLLVVQPSVNQSFAKGIERSVGVIVGVLVASGLAILFGAAWWVVLVAMTAALLLAWGLRMTPGSANQIGISALLVIALGASTPEYAVHRVVETVLGVVIGFIVNIAIVPPVALAPAQREVRAFLTELSARLSALGRALARETTAPERTEMMIEVRLLRPMLAKALARIDTAEDTLTLNPRGRAVRARVAELRHMVDAVAPIVTQLIGMTRTYVDRAVPGLADDASVEAISEQLSRAAHDVDVLRSRVPNPDGHGEEAAPVRAEPPALTRPLRITEPSGDHWVLVGSLLVDMERIHAALTELVD